MTDDPTPADEFEAEILAEHGPAALRAVQRFLNPPPPKTKPPIRSTEPPQPGRTFAPGATRRHAGLRDSL